MKIFLSSAIIDTRFNYSKLNSISFEGDRIKLFYEDGNSIFVSSVDLKNDKECLFRYFHRIEKIKPYHYKSKVEN